MVELVKMSEADLQEIVGAKEGKRIYEFLDRKVGQEGQEEPDE